MLRRLADPLQRILGALPPASGAVVMGTGIVSVGLSLDGRETLSRILLVITAIAWVILAVLLAARVSRDPIRVHQEARSPAGLTGVAGTEVLGTRTTLLGWTWVGIALLIIGLVLWLVLLWPVLANWWPKVRRATRSPPQARTSRRTSEPPCSRSGCTRPAAVSAARPPTHPR